MTSQELARWVTRRKETIVESWTRHQLDRDLLARYQVAGAEDSVYNPAFDVTPARLVTAFVTEYGVIRPPYYESIPDLQARPNFLAANRH